MPVHSDYIRAGENAPNDPNIFCSGGYDHQINVLDMRSSEITMSFNHGAPVESLCLFPSMSLIVSTGGTLIKVWDCYQRKLLTSLSSHTKTVTSCRLNHTNTKIITAGLDKRVNVFNSLDYSQCATFESGKFFLIFVIFEFVFQTRQFYHLTCRIMTRRSHLVWPVVLFPWLSVVQFTQSKF